MRLKLIDEAFPQSFSQQQQRLQQHYSPTYTNKICKNKRHCKNFSTLLETANNHWKARVEVGLLVYCRGCKGKGVFVWNICVNVNLYISIEDRCPSFFRPSAFVGFSQKHLNDHRWATKNLDPLKWPRGEEWSGKF